MTLGEVPCSGDDERSSSLPVAATLVHLTREDAKGLF
jgi:hypothetical protein